ncbi:MAG TPA: hypothetical protein ENJ95_18105 [Bacteroidetes bacterium]|nr:hypothetical protein [Bacteroidota bacterium]
MHLNNYHLARLFPLLPIFSFFIFSCYPGGSPEGQTVLVSNARTGNFADYWFAGEGEINSYDLQQSRYGEMREGEAIMVFVTEDFSKEKQVKLDKPKKAGSDKVPVLKLNYLRRFVTGIYDYSMMQSVFTPIDQAQFPRSLKATTTSQDWCGHFFLQMNLEGEKYNARSFSYFESEGDQDVKLKADFLEDELWTRIRLDPESIKEGTYEVIPSAFYSRLTHDPPKAKQARIRFEKQETSTSLVLEYLHLDRTLTIGFDPVFPHKILSWTEMQDGKLMSKGTLKGSVKSAYWKQHGNRDEYLREKLGL